MQVYMKYPYILYESFIPASMFLWYTNPLGLTFTLNYVFFMGASTLWWPRVWYWAEFRRRIRRMWLVRGGRFVKFEASGMSGDRYTYWAEMKYMNLLTDDMMHFDNDNAEFLKEDGQL